MVYAVGAQQMVDITDYLKALNEADKRIESRDTEGGFQLGDGFRAVLKGGIEVVTDSGLLPNEVLGWIAQSDTGWQFTQNEVEK